MTKPSFSDKPDISKANTCPPLPNNASGLDKLVYWLGIGLGSGMPKRAPGTWGSIGGMLIALPILQLGFMPFLIITIVASIVGIWICDRTSKLMHVHDDPHIVWDEWAGMWIAMLPIAYHISQSTTHNAIDLLLNSTFWVLVAVSFIAFRFFDILKPFPIGYLDKKLDGGLGIMLDDVLAGIFSCIIVACTPYILLYINIFVFGQPAP